MIRMPEGPSGVKVLRQRHASYYAGQPYDSCNEMVTIPDAARNYSILYLLTKYATVQEWAKIQRIPLLARLSIILSIFFVRSFIFSFLFLRLRFRETTAYPVLINSSCSAFLSLLIWSKEDLRKNLFRVFDGHLFYNFKIEFIRGALLRRYVVRNSSGS